MNRNRSGAQRLRGLLRRLSGPPSSSPRAGEVGQVLPLVAIMAVVLIGGAALVTDVAWWWTYEQRMQRAADAGALAGAPYLPDREGLAILAANAETARNGFADGQGGVTVNALADRDDPRKMVVEIDGPLETNFARVFGLRTVAVGVRAAGKFQVEVPLGSPQNYYGLGYLVDASTSTSTAATNWLPAGATRGTLSGQWSDHNNVYVDDGQRATTSTNGAVQNWGEFDISLPAGATATGIEVRLNSSVNTAGTGCRFSVDLYNGGSYTSVGRQTPDLTTSNPLGGTDTNHDLGSSTDMWGHQDWTASELSNANFRVRVTYDRPGSCGATGWIDLVAVRVHYTTTTTTYGPRDVTAPNSSTVLTPQNFWGALQSRGAPNIQGDAYMTYYDTRTSTTNKDYNPEGYYQYGIEFPEGSSSGEVWLFDPGFCNVDSDKGTGEYYTLGGANGSAAFEPVSTYFDLWDTKNTAYDTTDDGISGQPNYSSGDAYEEKAWYDTRLDITNPRWTAADACDGLPWHNNWVRIASGIDGGTKWRLHTFSTKKNGSPSHQLDTTALNAFAIYASASGGTPRVYGLGAMEAYVRLPGGRASEFYLARVDADYAGYTMQILLWDPGDTGQLAADLQILYPGEDDYEVATFDWAAKRGSGAASNCGPNDEFGDYPGDVDQTDVTSVRTNTGGTSLFNGCWLRIEIELPSDYEAPRPASENPSIEGGWWKIVYNMSGSASSYSTDLTTWQVRMIGNPVHLVPE